MILGGPTLKNQEGQFTVSVALSPEGPEGKGGIKLFYAKDKVYLELISKKKKKKS